MSDSTNSVLERAFDAVREFQEHPQGMFVNTSRGRELGMMTGGATAAMRVLLAEFKTGWVTMNRSEILAQIDSLRKELGDVE